MRFFPGRFEIHPAFDQRRPQRGHRRVLLRAVAERDDDGNRQIESLAGPGQRLAMIPARRRNQAALVSGPAVPIGEHNPAAHLESAGGQMVFMLDPDLGAGPSRQQRPRDLRRGRKVASHQIRCILQRRQGKRHHGRIGHLCPYVCPYRCLHWCPTSCLSTRINGFQASTYSGSGAWPT